MELVLHALLKKLVMYCKAYFIIVSTWKPPRYHVVHDFLGWEFVTYNLITITGFVSQIMFHLSLYQNWVVIGTGEIEGFYRR